MTNLLTTQLNRRSLLTTAAKGALAIGGLSAAGIGPALANAGSGNATEYWNKGRVNQYLCSQIHLHKSQQLSRDLSDDKLDAYAKNVALRTAHCPSCGVRIHPGGAVAGYRIGV